MASAALEPPPAGAAVAARQIGQRRLAHGLMLASGCAALGYQIVWTQQSALWLGHETAAVLAVVAAFFGGLASGALLLGARIERSRRPGRWYAVCEAVIGLWSLALALLMAPLAGALMALTGAQPSPAWQWTVAFVGTFVLLLPATAAMGATLPAMERLLARLHEGGRHIGALYASNTFGAVLGVVGAAFWLVPTLGLTRTAFACTLLNLVCAVLAWRLFPANSPAPPAAVDAIAPRRGPLVLLATTGLFGIGYEVLAVRVLSQIAENTVYTFALLLAVYLVGTALGAAAYSRWLAATSDPARLRDRLLQALAAACLLGLLAMASADTLKEAVLRLAGPSLAAALAAEAALAVAAFLLPTLVMGALFSHLASSARASGIVFGRAIGVNTLGAAVAPMVFGVVLVPAAGLFAATLAVVAGYLLLSLRRATPAPAFWAVATTTLGVAIAAPSLRFVDVPEGGRLISHRDGAMAAVSIVEDARGVATLHINNRQQEGSSATRLADARQALLPLLLHPAPQRALFLGVGTGVTAASAAQEAMLQVDAVELLPEVIAASAHFRQPFEAEAPGTSARLHLQVADARRFVRASAQRYDLIVSDNFHPARSGSGSLYTVEHFTAVRERLAPAGVFCQWVPLHQLDLDTLRSIVRAFRIAFPDGWAMLATYSLDTPVVGLVGRADDRRFDWAALRARLDRIDLPRRPAEFGLGDDLALLGSFLAGPASLERFAGAAPINADDRPVVAYRAPRLTYAPDSRPRDRLIALLTALQVTPEEVLGSSVDDLGSQRLAAYWQARDHFIRSGYAVQPTADVHRMLAQVREPLLEALRISPDFRPAYEPLLRMALALARTDVDLARTLLTDLQRVQPARPEASRALLELRDPRR